MGKVKVATVLGAEEALEEAKKRKAEKKAKETKKMEKIAEEITERNEFGEVVTPAPKPKKQEAEKVKKHVHGKNIKKARTQVDKTKTYSLKEAIELVKKLKYSKLDESLEVHINLNKTPLKGEVEMPHSIGKTVRVAIVSDELLAELESGKIHFDMLVTHPMYMPKLAKFAKLLGPKGLMPSPKTGTISDKPQELAEKLQGNLLKWKSESKFPLLHQTVGKLSMESEKLEENVKTLLDSVGKSNIVSVYVAGTMTPSVKVALE